MGSKPHYSTAQRRLILRIRCRARQAGTDLDLLYPRLIVPPPPFRSDLIPWRSLLQADLGIAKTSLPNFPKQLATSANTGRKQRSACGLCALGWDSPTLCLFQRLDENGKGAGCIFRCAGIWRGRGESHLFFFLSRSLSSSSARIRHGSWGVFPRDWSN